MTLGRRSIKQMIRLSVRGCTNRPFYHIVIMNNYQGRDRRVIDQIGTYDPLPNRHNERLVALNFNKLRAWIGKGAQCSTAVDILLGYAGYFPIHPRTRLQAYRLQKEKEEKSKPQKQEQTDAKEDS